MNSTRNFKVLIALLTVLQFILPGSVFSDAGPPDVVNVSSIEEAENLMPVSGEINSISFESSEVVISDSHYMMSPDTKYYSVNGRQTSPDSFIVGAWVGAYLDENRKIKSLYLTNSRQGTTSGESPVRQPPVNRNDDGFYQEDGVYKN